MLSLLADPVALRLAHPLLLGAIRWGAMFIVCGGFAAALPVWRWEQTRVEEKGDR